MSQSEEYVTIRHAIEQLIDANTALRRENRLLVTRVEDLGDAHNIAIDALRDIVEMAASGASPERLAQIARKIVHPDLAPEYDDDGTELDPDEAEEPEAPNTPEEPRPFLVCNLHDRDLFWNGHTWGIRANAKHYSLAERNLAPMPPAEGYWLVTEGFRGDGCGPSEVKP